MIIVLKNNGAFVCSGSLWGSKILNEEKILLSLDSDDSEMANDDHSILGLILEPQRNNSYKK